MRAQHACPPAPATCLAPAAARRSHLLPPARPACPKPQPQPHSQLHPAAASTLLPHPATSHARERRRRHHATRAGGANGTVGAAPSPPGPLGVVIVDHGSRKAASNDMLLDFVALYKQTSGAQIVEPAHMELAEPTIEQAVGRCVGAGATRVVVAPYFLSKGRHIQEDIPALVQAAQAKYPGVQCIIADPIGIDPLMAQLISNRVHAAAAQAPTGVV